MASKPSPAPSERPDILRYDDFRSFLKDLFAYEKARNPRFSLGVFSRRAGVSRSHFKVVTDYRWKLTDGYIRRYAVGLRLSDAESAFFHRLVRHNQDKDPARREEAERELKRMGWTMRRRALRVEEVRALLERWHAPVVLGLTKLADFRADPGWISRRMGGRLTAKQAAEALSLLVRLGLIRIEGGRIVPGPPPRVAATWGDSAPSHRDGTNPWLWREGARQVRRDQGAGNSFGVMVSIPCEKAKELTQEIFRHAMGAIQRRQQPEGELCVFLGGVFPLTRPATAGEGARRARPRKRR